MAIVDAIRKLITTNPFEFLVIVLAGGLLSGIWFTLKLSRFRSRRSGYRERNRGLKAEDKAIRLLKKHGYKIVDQDPRFSTDLVVNGERDTFEITPDLVVSKNNRQYVVEIKSGEGDIAKALIRRQVMEYMVASELPCLLVLMPEGYIDLIEMP